MNEEGRYSRRPYYRRWDSWNNALEVAGFEPNHYNTYDESDLVAEMQQLADEYGYPPTMQQMRDDGKNSPRPFMTTFGSWVNACKAAGVEHQNGNVAGRASREELLAALQCVANSVDGAPTREDIIERGAV